VDRDPHWVPNKNVPEPLDEVVHRLTSWLMSPPVLRRTGPGAGIVNFLTPEGTWDGLYPEICGYYLQFAVRAASRTSRDKDDLYRSAAASVATWLNEVGGVNAEPLTLYHRDMRETDWRNQCLFAFDLAIILRGLATAEARWPGVVPPGAIERYTRSILRIGEKGRLGSHLCRPGAAVAEIPVKWSTTQGVLHVKAAAALLGLGQPDLADVARATLLDEATLFAREGEHRMRELHPFLYAVEGWLTVWGQTGDPDALATARRAFCMVMKQIDRSTGELPPVADERDAVVRSDVIAQALRAGLVLEAAEQLSDEIGEAWRTRRRALESALLARVSEEGGMIFDDVGRHRNSWASMFAWQALCFLRQSQMRTLDPVLAAAEII